MAYWRRRAEARDFRVARTLFLAWHTFKQLPPGQQAVVQQSVDAYLLAIGFYVAAWRRYGSWSAKAANLAIGLYSAGIKPALPGEEWELPDRARIRPVRSWVGVPTMRSMRAGNHAATLWLQFHPMSAGAERAKRYLLERGIDVDAVLPNPLDEAYPHWGSHGSKPSTWREWLTGRESNRGP